MLSLLFVALSFLSAFAAPSVGQVVLVDTPLVGATQEQVGYRAVDRMIEFWTKDCTNLACLISQFRKNVVEKPVPGFMSPPLDGSSTQPKIYITDGHHRASALDRVMHGKLTDLPPKVQALLANGGQKYLVKDPTFRLSVRIEAIYPTRGDAALGMAALGKGQLSVESRRAVPDFDKALNQVRAGNPADANVLLAAYQNLPAGLGGLEDSALRSAVGAVFFNLGLDSVHYVDYIEFHVAEQLAKQGFKFLPGDVLSSANLELVRHSILTDPKIVNLITASVLPGKLDLVKKDNAWPVLQDALRGKLSKSPMVNIVYDIDQTIATLVHEGPGGDLLADPKQPNKSVYTITFDQPEVDSMNRPVLDSNGLPIKKKVTERYRVYEGFVEQMEKLRKEQIAGRIRTSFFSGGHLERNRALLDAIKLSDGTSVRTVVTDANIYGRESMVATGVGPEGRVRERFKKDLRIINPDISNVILVDDIPNFVPDSQLNHVVWLDEDFPYPERRAGRPFVMPTPARIQQERNKFSVISQRLDEALALHFNDGVPLSNAIHQTVGPVKLSARPCTPDDIFMALNRLLQI